MNRHVEQAPSDRTRPRRAIQRRRGAAMSEMVLVAPFLLLFLVLVLFFGRMMVHAQRTQVAARYETWRQVAGAPGPSPSHPPESELHNWQINEVFFADQAASVGDSVADGSFPSLQAAGQSTHARLIERTLEVSDAAGAFAGALMYAPQSDPLSPRFPHGLSERIVSRHEGGPASVQRYIGPIRRTHGRVGNAWQFTDDWRAGPDRWQSHGRLAPHHLRALRDVYLADFDARLDGIDGDATPEYPSDDETENSRTEALAGFIRSLYLHEPGYRGPIVYDENP